MKLTNKELLFNAIDSACDNKFYCTNCDEQCLDNCNNKLAESLDSQNILVLKPLKVLPWEKAKDELKEDCKGIWGKYKKWYMENYDNLRNNKHLYIECHYLDEPNFAHFDFTEQGYKEAIEWLENERLESIKSLCED